MPTNPSHLPALEELIEKIQKAVPSLTGKECVHCGWTWDIDVTNCLSPSCTYHQTDLRIWAEEPGLEEVFRAIQENNIPYKTLFEFGLGAYGWFTFTFDKGNPVGWRLGFSLNDQSPEFIAFLNDLLPSGV